MRLKLVHNTHTKNSFCIYSLFPIYTLSTFYTHTHTHKVSIHTVYGVCRVCVNSICIYTQCYVYDAETVANCPPPCRDDERIRRDRTRRCFIAVLLCAVSLRLSNASRQFSKEEKTNVRILYTYIIRVSDEFSYPSVRILATTTTR